MYDGVEMVFISKQSMPEPIITNFHFSLEPSVSRTNSPQMHFRLKSWTCLKKTLSILPMSCPTTTNYYLLSAFILHYTNLESSLFSHFLTNNTLHLFFPLPHTAYKHLNRWKAIKPETWNLISRNSSHHEFVFPASRYLCHVTVCCQHVSSFPSPFLSSNVWLVEIVWIQSGDTDQGYLSLTFIWPEISGYRCQ